MNAGDIVFANQFRITEAMSTSSPESLIFKNATSTPIFTLDENGQLTTSKLVAKEIETEKISIKNSEVSQTGITIYSRDTNEPYCVFIEAGQMQSSPGICGEQSTTTTSTTTQIYYYDGDGDGYGYYANFVTGSIQEGYVANSDDCDDSNANVNPGTTEICGDNLDNNCNGLVDENCQSATTTEATTTEATSTEPACAPNWQCTAWQPLPETIACGATSAQSRTCTDLNECGTDEGKPIESQEITGTDAGKTSCDASKNLVGECQNSCVNGSLQACTPTCTCAAGFSDCNSDMTDGCETAGDCQAAATSSESTATTTTPK